jgi:hypothetical protein
VGDILLDLMNTICFLVIILWVSLSPTNPWIGFIISFYFSFGLKNGHHFKNHLLKSASTFSLQVSLASWKAIRKDAKFRETNKQARIEDSSNME